MDGLKPTFVRRSWSPLPEKNSEGPAAHIPVPEKVMLPLQDLPGDSFEVLVSTGEYVRGGQKIGTIGIHPQYLAVHTPCAGRVSAIEQRILEAGGERRVLTVEITAVQEQECAPAVPFSQFRGDWSMFLRDMGVPLDFEQLSTARALIVKLFARLFEGAHGKGRP